VPAEAVLRVFSVNQTVARLGSIEIELAVFLQFRSLDSVPIKSPCAAAQALGIFYKNKSHNYRAVLRIIIIHVHSTWFLFFGHSPYSLA